MVKSNLSLITSSSYLSSSIGMDMAKIEYERTLAAGHLINERTRSEREYQDTIQRDLQNSMHLRGKEDAAEHHRRQMELDDAAHRRLEALESARHRRRMEELATIASINRGVSLDQVQLLAQQQMPAVFKLSRYQEDQEFDDQNDNPNNK